MNRRRLGVVAYPAMGPMALELAAAAFASAAHLGLETVAVAGPSDSDPMHWLLGIGPDEVYREELAAAADRPNLVRIAWTGEPLIPPPARRPVLAGIARSRAMRNLRMPPAWRGAVLPGPLGRVRQNIRNQKELGRNARLIPALAEVTSRLVVTSRPAQALLWARGIEARVVPFGYEPSVHGLLTPPQVERDLGLVSLAHARDSRLYVRRAMLVRKLIAAEPTLTVAEGIWGEARNELLRRTRVVVNVQRVEGTFIGLRLVLALAAGAVVVTEPMTDPYPFVPGIHYVEAPLDRLLPEARALLTDETRRRDIVAAGQELLAGELSMTRCLERVLD